MMFMREARSRHRAHAILLLTTLTLYLLPFSTLLAQEVPVDDVAIGIPRIVGGTPADPGEYPWQAMLLDRWGNFFCGGTLIAPDWVLTAGHCTYGITVDRVVLGAHRRMDSQEPSRQTVAVDRTIRHHDYNDDSLQHDIALLHLSQPVTVNQWVAPVTTVATADDEILGTPGTLALITGWGAVAEGGLFAAVLQEVSVPIVAQNQCQAAYPGAITDSMFCAGYREGGKDACQGDSGGPLIVRDDSDGEDDSDGWKLAGIISWGRGCGDADSYGIYTKVAAYHAWIFEQTGAETAPTASPTLTPTRVGTPTPVGTPAPSPTATPQPSLPPSGLEILGNGDFEAGRDGSWIEESQQHSTLIHTTLPVAPHGGTYAALLGNADAETSRLYQWVKLPHVDHLYLVFHHQIRSTEESCGRDKARVYLSSRRALELNLCTQSATTAWEAVIIDISRYAGTQKKLQFFTKTSRRDESSWLIDDVYFTTRVDERRAYQVYQAEDIEDWEAEEDGELLYLPIILK